MSHSLRGKREIVQCKAVVALEPSTGNGGRCFRTSHIDRIRTGDSVGPEAFRSGKLEEVFHPDGRRCEVFSGSFNRVPIGPRVLHRQSPGPMGTRLNWKKPGAKARQAHEASSWGLFRRRMAPASH